MHCHVTKSTATLLSSSRVLQLLRKQFSFSSTVDDNEISKFSLDESEWWDIGRGPLAPVHTLNTLRVPFIKESLIGINNDALLSAAPLTGYRILDVGCGGGILAEPLARLGANVTGIDPTPTAIAIATARARRDPSLFDRLVYHNCSVEEMRERWIEEREDFDCVIASEVIEHVGNVNLFVKNVCQLVKPGGVAFFSTINRTFLSLMVAKIAAEYLTGVIPKGTHEWDMFVPPEELKSMLIEEGFNTINTKGMFYNVLSGKWYCIRDVSVNYCISAVKTTPTLDKTTPTLNTN